MKRGTLILEDDSEFEGFVFGASTNTSGEVGKTIIIDFFFFLFNITSV
jgi:carbamoylphosphate synthase small subunit